MADISSSEILIMMKQIITKYDILSSSQIDSYDYFINYLLKNTIMMHNPIIIRSDNDYDVASNTYGLEIHIHFENIRLKYPTIHENDGSFKLLFPHFARLRNACYACHVIADMRIEYVIRTGLSMEHVERKTNTFTNLTLCDMLPVMIQSNACHLKTTMGMSSTDMYSTMLPKNSECSYDVGGYFIINGMEKVVIGQERQSENVIFCKNMLKKNIKMGWIVEVRSVANFNFISTKQTSLHLVTKKHDNREVGEIWVQFPRMRSIMPLFVIFRALGLNSDKEICNYILYFCNQNDKSWLLDLLYPSIHGSRKWRTHEDALLHMTSYVTMSTVMSAKYQKDVVDLKKKFLSQTVLVEDLLPHCTGPIQKLYMLGQMTSVLLHTAHKKMPVTERDSYEKKRIDLVGHSMNNLLRSYMKKLVDRLRRMCLKEMNNDKWKHNGKYDAIINEINIHKCLNMFCLGDGFRRSFGSGDFSIKAGTQSKVGAAHIYNRLNPLSSVTYVKRLTSSSASEKNNNRLIEPRKFHMSSYGYICPYETPEGEQIGMVKNLSALAYITIPVQMDQIYKRIVQLVTPIEEIYSPVIIAGKIRVTLNGSIVGICIDKHPLEVYRTLKHYKCTSIINIYTSIVLDVANLEIRVCCEHGRVTRPLFRVSVCGRRLLVSRQHLQMAAEGKIMWQDLLSNIHGEGNAVVEYVDADEQNFARIANSVEEFYEKCGSEIYTYCEIHSSFILGVTAACIPFANHNQSPRITYQSAQSKQALAPLTIEHYERMDKTTLALEYPSCPLVDTTIYDIIGMNQLPAGATVTVAIGSFTGFNQEDSIMCNKDAIDRGLFQTTKYSTEKNETKKKINGGGGGGSREEYYCKPDPLLTQDLHTSNYDKLDKTGFMFRNEIVNNRDVIIGKVCVNPPPPPAASAAAAAAAAAAAVHYKYTDMSVTYKTNDHDVSFLDKNTMKQNVDGYPMAKVRLRTVRKPVIGDKFSSRHGQKGTIGILYSQKDMPYSAVNGKVPDIIINPHAIPSRMTIGHIKETQLGIILGSLGFFADGTCFSNEFSVAWMQDMMMKLGYETGGNHLFYDPKTGKQMEMTLFMGPIFYQRLKHMVHDKCRARANGINVLLTRQPTDGIKRSGGLRLGEMERDCLIAHGLSHSMHERFYICADKYEHYVCMSCGFTAVYNDAEKIYKCVMCDQKTASFSRVNLPYAAKLFLQELNAINVSTRLITSKATQEIKNKKNYA